MEGTAMPRVVVSRLSISINVGQSLVIPEPKFDETIAELESRRIDTINRVQVVKRKTKLKPRRQPQPKSPIKELAMKRLLLIVLVSLCLPAIAQTHRYQVSAIAAMRSGLAAPTPTTWYVRKAGGTPKTCAGKADAAPIGSASNQHCAFGDYRFLYDDQSGKPLKWVMAGGDKVILKDGPGRGGFHEGGEFKAGLGWEGTRSSSKMDRGGWASIRGRIRTMPGVARGWVRRHQRLRPFQPERRRC